MINRIFAAAAIGAMLISAPVLADEADGADAPKMSVEYSDLDLTTEKGQSALERRVLAAARKVCRTGYVATGTRVISPEQKHCLDEATTSAKRQVAAIIEAANRGG